MRQLGRRTCRRCGHGWRRHRRYLRLGSEGWLLGRRGRGECFAGGCPCPRHERVAAPPTWWDLAQAYARNELGDRSPFWY